MQQLMATAQSYETNGARAKSFNLSWELKYFISTYGHVWHPPHPITPLYSPPQTCSETETETNDRKCITKH